MYIFPKIIDTPMSIAYRKLPQAQRAWYTTIAFVDNAVYLYLSVFMLIVSFVMGACQYSLDIKKEDLIRNVFYVMASTVCAFSFTILPTPAFYILTISAFTILYSDAEDLFQSALYGLLGLLMVVSYMLAREGDITGSLQFFNITPLFTRLSEEMAAAGEGVRWTSILHTISGAAMFCSFLIFTKKANNVIGIRKPDKKRVDI